MKIHSSRVETCVSKVRYHIEPSKLEGSVRISGAKNSVLKLMTASLLTDGTVHIDNYPAGILDAQIHFGMLEALGKRCTVRDGAMIVESLTPLSSTLEWDQRSIRNTLLILGALVTRTGHGAVPLPGGCKLGDRKFDIHELVLRTFGAEVWTEGNYLLAETTGRMKGSDIHLPIRSTGATENAIICGSLAEGRTRIWNPHIRPEIMDLIRFLRRMGARIKVYGQEHIEIEGVEALSGVRHSVIPDNMEALTWMIGAVVTGGDVEIHSFPFNELEVPLIHLRESGALFYRNGDSVIVRGGRCYPIEISTGPYPSINSDMQPLFALYGACANGESRIVDLRFRGRYGYTAEFAKMGIRSSIDGDMLKIDGGAKVRGAEVTAVDLRAGVALVLAGLAAEGPTVLNDAWQVERGYDRFVDKVQALNGRVEHM